MANHVGLATMGVYICLTLNLRPLSCYMDLLRMVGSVYADYLTITSTCTCRATKKKYAMNIEVYYVYCTRRVTERVTSIVYTKYYCFVM